MRRRALQAAAILTFAALPALLPLPTSAAILSATANVTVGPMPPGADLSEGGPYEGAPGGGNTVYAFEEGQDIVVTDLAFDVDAAGLGVGWSGGDPTGAFLANGTIDSHYLHLDTPNGNLLTLSGFVEFDAPVLGVMVETTTLDAGDAAVGSGGVTFESGRVLGPTDSFSLEANDRRLVFSFQNGANVDQVRVLTGGVASGGPVTEIVVAGGEAFVPNGAFEGDASGTNTVFFFHERTGVDVVDLDVDLDTAALQSGWAHPAPSQPTTLTGRVDSHYLFFDSVVDSATTVISGSIAFDEPVLGVAFSTGPLADSDFLTIPGVTFAGTRNLGTNGDAVSLDPTGRILSFTFANFDRSDDLRILTASPPAIPSIGGWGALALGTGLLLMGALRGARTRDEAVRDVERRGTR